MLMRRTGVLLVAAVVFWMSNDGVVVLSRVSRPWLGGSLVLDGDCVMMPFEKQSVPTSLSSQSRWNVLQW